IGAGDLPQLLVYNKIDLLDGAAADSGRVDGARTAAPAEHASAPAWAVDGAEAAVQPRVRVSAVERRGIGDLLEGIGRQLGDERVRADVRLPLDAGRLRARLHAQGLVADESSDEGGWKIHIDAPRSRVEPLFGLPD